MEIYKDIVGYEGHYMVSNLGNVKSIKFNKEKYLKSSKNYKGYLTIMLSINNIGKRIRIHQLVAESFLNHQRCGMELVINHIDFNKVNNRVENLEIVTNRENCNLKHLKSSSIYTGVSWDKRYNKWRSNITVNRKLKHLGYFIDELEASEAYQKELNNLTN
jgi:hypothetical protein